MRQFQPETVKIKQLKEINVITSVKIWDLTHVIIVNRRFVLYMSANMNGTWKKE
jgi:hypothetical protein